MSATTFLRRVLAFDALSCFVMGIVLLFAAAPLAPLLGLPEPLLRWAGGLLVPAGAFIGWLSSRPAPLTFPVWVVIIGNLAWVAKSLLVIGAYDTISALGVAFVATQAATVLALAGLEHAGLRRMQAQA